MSRARRTLHLAAAAVPLLLVYTASLLLDDGWGGVKFFGIDVVVCGQLACLICWPLLERRARAGRSGWLAGAILAVLAYVGFAVVMTVAGTEFFTRHPASDLWRRFYMTLLVPAVITGWAGFPLTMLIAQWTVRRRNEELHHAA